MASEWYVRLIHFIVIQFLMWQQLWMGEMKMVCVHVTQHNNRRSVCRYRIVKCFHYSVNSTAYMTVSKCMNRVVHTTGASISIHFREYKNKKLNRMNIRQATHFYTLPIFYYIGVITPSKQDCQQFCQIWWSNDGSFALLFICNLLCIKFGTFSILLCI